MHRINIAKEFTETPGGRFRQDGKFSGQEFREEYLDPSFQDRYDASKIVIELDGAFGYPTSFLEEVFGGLARKYGKKRVLGRLELISNDEPALVRRIVSYIEGAGK